MLRNLNHRLHFYFCLLVALKMNEGLKRNPDVRNKNNFLLKWLRNAQKNNVFMPDVNSEIIWLREKIMKSGPDNDIEPMLTFIYQSARAAGLER